MSSTRAYAEQAVFLKKDLSGLFAFKFFLPADDGGFSVPVR